MRVRNVMQVHYMGYTEPQSSGEAEAELRGINSAIAHLKVRATQMEMAILELKYGKFDESTFEKQIREKQENQQKVLTQIQEAENEVEEKSPEKDQGEDQGEDQEEHVLTTVSPLTVAEDAVKSDEFLSGDSE